MNTQTVSVEKYMSLQPNEMPDALSFALRLTEISRWGIVASSRQQSVGEHCYRVCMIAVALYDYMENGTPHNSDDRKSIVSFAMTHDMFEILTGDLDSVFKMAMKSLYPLAYAQTVEKMASERRDTSKLYLTLAAQERAAAGSVVEAIVKLADLLEAVIYITDYGTNTFHTGQVREHILARIWDRLQEYKRSPHLKLHDWARAEDFINKLPCIHTVLR